MSVSESYQIVQHNMRVSRLAEKVAYAIGMDDAICQEIAVAGSFIDIGKLDMDAKVFNNTRDLTDDEYNYVKQHTSKSSQMIMQAKLITKEILMDIIHHHENFDGTGYPDGLAGEDIPVGSRILKICDVFFALLEKRPFREDYSKKEALLIMEKQVHHFDPKIWPIFKDIVQSSRIMM